MPTLKPQPEIGIKKWDLSDRLHWIVLALLSSSIALNLLDRQILSLLAPILREQLSLSNTGYSYIVFAFQLGMFLGQVPAGVLMDRLGTRIGMAAIVVAWSVFSGLHAFARTMGAFLALRFLMGVSECGNYTGGIKAIARLFPAKGRALAGGIFNAGAQLGSVVAPPLIVFIATRYGWPASFLIPSFFTILWIGPWLRFFPREPVRSTDSRQRSNRSGSLWLMLRNRQVFGLFLLRVFSGPLTSFYWYWLPEYLRHARGMSMILIGMMAWIPYVFGSLGNLGGGYVSDWLIRRGWSTDRARKACLAGGLGLSALSLILPFIPSNVAALAVVCLIVFGNNCTAACYISSVGDMFAPSIVGRVNGIAGAGDSGMGMVAMLLTGIAVDHFSYTPVLIMAGILPIFSLASILFVIRRIEPTTIAGLEEQTA